jgi:hypothetical protein
MSDRVLRTKPLLTVKTRVLDEKRAALAAALRNANTARTAQHLAEAAWEERVAALATGHYETIAEHLEARTHLESLKRAATCAAERATLATRAEAAARESLIVAERELKKIEAWRDGILETERAAQERSERIGADELAARMFQARR